MAVILTILKILGIILLSILGLLLLIFLLVMAVPIRYNGRFQKSESMDGEANVSWLLHLIHIKAIYGEDGFKAIIRIFGIRLKSSEEKEKKRKRKEEKKRKKKKAESSDNNDTESITDNDNEVFDDEYLKSETNQDNFKDEQESSGDEVDVQEALSDEADKNDSVKMKAVDDKSSQEPAKKKKLFGRRKNKKPKEKKPSIVERIKAKYNSIRKKAEKITAIIEDERIKKTVAYLWNKLKQILKHVFPRKIKGYLKYGFDDPSTTGYLTAFLASQYSKFGKNFSAEPDFENKVLEGNIKAKGRIRLGYLAITGLKILFNKDLKYTRKRIKEFKEGD